MRINMYEAPREIYEKFLPAKNTISKKSVLFKKNVKLSVSSLSKMYEVK